MWWCDTGRKAIALNGRERDGCMHICACHSTQHEAITRVRRRNTTKAWLGLDLRSSDKDSR